ncbi:unnamed protein product [Angiostrongylus costaricensis]|uniref:Uncharacterized protein n=1 Tax=Angiostrongylus costaricensis TaxID=334426 RepID=A0A0R3PTU9_ANGCS|nr:unnamed protein product [Angiostrongylus costaricensis]
MCGYDRGCKAALDRAKRVAPHHTGSEAPCLARLRRPAVRTPSAANQGLTPPQHNIAGFYFCDTLTLTSQCFFAVVAVALC